ncbi:MAG: amino acid adenylation domain-containing protein, partial [Chloroflexota bacterium]
MNDILQKLAHLPPEKQDLILRKLRQKRRQGKNGRSHKQPTTIQPASRGNDLPLSFTQQRLWFLDALEGANAIYNLTSAWRLRGVLRLEVLEQAANTLIERHEVFRTQIVTEEGVGKQVIVPHLDLTIPVTDLQHLAGEAQAAVARDMMLAVAQEPFDLAVAPLLRMAVVRLGAEDHILVSQAHHIIADGWSEGIILRELVALYTAYAEGQSNPLQPLPLQYADYAVWQRGHLQGEVLEKQLAYWRDQLADAPALLELPTDRPRPAMETHRGSNVAVQLSRKLTGELTAVSQAHEATLFMTLLAAWSLLLARYSRQEQVVIGTPIANRQRVELQNLIGFFANTLALKIDTDGNPAFTDLLAQVKERTLGAHTHQDVPFEKLVEELVNERDMSYSPLFQVMFAWQNTPRMALTLPGLTAELLPQENEVAMFDLTLSLAETKQGISGFLNYNSDLFDQATIERLADQFEVLLKAIVAAPATPIEKLPLLPEAEEDQLLVEWNDTTTDYPNEKTIIQLFEEQVTRTPNAVAVRFEEEQLAYQELNARANQLARHLTAAGIQPQMRVGIQMDRSLKMMVALLGTLKTGATYVPLDPMFPPDRIAFMKADADLALVLTDEAWPDLTGYEDTNLGRDLSTDSVAYMIYTSGSTGRPKGVEIEQQSLTNFLYAMRDSLEITNRDNLLAVTTLSFDIAALELYVPLIVGGTVSIASRAAVSDGEWLREQLDEGDITVMQATPATWRLLLVAGWQGKRACKLLCGGEALPSELASKLLERSDRLWNMYGPTEATIWATMKRVTAADIEQSVVSIGRPIANTQLYILDTHQAPVPLGVAGELHIGGMQVARGYWQRPNLTADRFIPAPFGQGRLYKTGDLCRYLPDGNVEFLGRLDNQVKLRGFRIELGEIEAVLSQHPDVHEVVAIVREDTANEKRLAAYIVGAADAADLTPASLRAFLAAKVPEYMIPSAFVMLDALPLTPNGKINRRALPAPDGTAVVTNSQFVAPRTPAEQQLAQIWAACLNIEQMGIHDNFFALGGHSLLAMQVASRIREQLSIDLPLRALFAQPTIAELAGELQTAQQQTSATSIEQVARKEQMPLSFAQQRLWFLDQLEGSSATYNIGWGFQATGKLDVKRLQQALNTVVARHETLRTRFVTVEGVGMQEILPHLEVEILVTDLKTAVGANQAAAIRKRVQDFSAKPFDIASTPLLRVEVLQLDAEDHIILLNMHHVISDGWSIGVFTRELLTLYEAYTVAEDSNPRSSVAQERGYESSATTLEPLTVQYVDYAAWQRDYLQEEVLEEQLAYWREQLADAPTLLELPTDKPRPAIQQHEGDRVTAQLSAELSHQLTKFSQAHDVTLFMTLLAAWSVLLTRHSRQEQVVVGAPIANRPRVELEKMIGLFVNTLALKTDVSGNPTFADLLAQVKERTLGAYAHQDIPFEKLVEELVTERDMSYSPLFQVMLNMDNTPPLESELAGLTLQPVAEPDPIAKFMMTLYVAPVANQLNLELVYQTSLFSVERMTHFLAQFEQLLTQIVADPNEQIGNFSLVTPVAHKLLPDPTQPIPQPAFTPIPVLMTELAEQMPNQPAIEWNGKQWGYGQMMADATAVAHALVANGVTVGDVVGIHASRSYGAMVSMIGVLLSGSVMLNLADNLPTERQQLMLSEAQAKVVVNVGMANSLTAETLLQVEPKTGKVTHGSGNTGTLPQLTGADAAYIFFTSGTTGKPKGILGNHRGLAHFLAWERETFAVNSADRAAQLIGLSFDVVLRDIFLPLTSGATLCLPPEGAVLNPSEILHWLNSANITTMHIVPSLAATWLTQAAGHQIPSLRWSFFAGEALTDKLVARWRAVFTNTQIANMYGPTETTMAKCCYQVPSSPLSGIQSVGKPLPQTQALILNEHGTLCGVGEAGQIVIRTPFRTYGYINNHPENARFVPNPFRDDADDLIYYTGDQALYRPDGNLEFLGRVDHQVKIRGFRIELGEIEAALSQHPAVRDVIVLARDDGADEENGNQKQLVAYIVGETDTAEGGDLAPSALRTALAAKLPSHMFPAAFVLLETLPLTPNGKVNRRALPAPARQRNVPDTGAPRTPLEHQMVQIWEEMLSVYPVGIYDNFFELGGHSLLAVRLLARLNQAFGQQLLLNVLFQHPTVAALAERVGQADSLPTSTLIPLQPHGTNPAFYCLPGSGSHALYFHNLARALGEEQPFYGLEHVGLDGKTAVHHTVEEAAAYQVNKLREHQPEGPYYIGGHSFGAQIAFEMAVQLHNAGAELGLVSIFDAPAGIAERVGRDEIDIVLACEEALQKEIGQPMTLTREQLKPLSSDERLLRCQGALEATGALPANSNLGLLRGMVTVGLANMKTSYAPSAKIPAPIHLFVAQDNPNSDKEAIIASWQSWGEVTVHCVPGGHMTMLHEPHVQVSA